MYMSPGDGEQRATAEVVAVVPAAGRAARLGEIPFSKALYPVGFRRNADGTILRPKVACEYLLDSLQMAGVHRGLLVVRRGKWDVPEYLGDGSRFNMRLAYVPAESSPSVLHSIDLVYPFVREAIVAFGFPDVLFRPAAMFGRLIAHQARSNADVLLAVAPAETTDRLDRVEIDSAGRVLDVVTGRSRSDSHLKWIVAVWGPAFSQFMRDFLEERDTADAQEVFVGDVMRAAVMAGLRVDSLLFPDGVSIDIGTPEDLSEALRTADDFEP